MRKGWACIAKGSVRGEGGACMVKGGTCGGHCSGLCFAYFTKFRILTFDVYLVAFWKLIVIEGCPSK